MTSFPVWTCKYLLLLNSGTLLETFYHQTAHPNAKSTWHPCDLCMSILSCICTSNFFPPIPILTSASSNNLPSCTYVNDENYCCYSLWFHFPKIYCRELRIPVTERPVRTHSLCFLSCTEWDNLKNQNHLIFQPLQGFSPCLQIHLFFFCPVYFKEIASTTYLATYSGFQTWRFCKQIVSDRSCFFFYLLMFSKPSDSVLILYCEA